MYLADTNNLLRFLLLNDPAYPTIRLQALKDLPKFTRHYVTNRPHPCSYRPFDDGRETYHNSSRSDALTLGRPLKAGTTVEFKS